MLKCERCSKDYRIRTISENLGKHLCRDCIKHCSICGKGLPSSNWFGQDVSITGGIMASFPATAGIAILQELKRPWVGSGMCNACFWKVQNQSLT
jgi:hypothetical protein